jgi:uncharacterized protein (DUF2336 family)
MSSHRESRFAHLLQLASARTSDERREVLRLATEMFFQTKGERTADQSEMLDTLLCTIADGMQEGVLIELAERFADAPDAPLQLMRDLADHALPIAEPVLRRSLALSDDDLIRLIRTHSATHARLIAQRPQVSTRVSDVIVKEADDAAVGHLVNNSGAEFSRETFEAFVERARENQNLHSGLVARADIPLDLLNELYFLVEQRLRAAILARNAAVDTKTLDLAIKATRHRLQGHAAHLGEEIRAAKQAVERVRVSGGLKASMLISWWRNGQKCHFLCGLAELTGLDVEATRATIERRDIDALAMICRAADIERALFVTMATMIDDARDGVARAEEFGRMYAAVPRDAAQRAMRFYHARKASERTVTSAQR